MGSTKFFSVFYGVFLTGFCTVAWGGSLEAKKDDVDVFASADKSAAVIKKLKKGETVSSGERSGMYWQVNLAGGVKGYVSVLTVKVKADGGGGINDAIREAVKAGRANGEQDGARTRTAVMGVRGLDDTSDTANAGSLRPNLRAVYKMEDRVVSNEQLDQQGELVSAEIERRLK